MFYMTWQNRSDDECITDCIIKYKGLSATMSFEHAPGCKIIHASDVMGYLLNSYSHYADGSLEEELLDRYGDLKSITHEQYLYAVKVWEMHREVYNLMNGLFSSEELDLLMWVVSDI